MADGFQIEASGMLEAQKLATDIARRISDLTPAMKVVAAEIDRRTEESFQNSVSQTGEAFAPLARSTQLARLRKLKGASRRNKAGKFTPAAMRKREKLLAPGGMKALIDTARAKNSAHAVVDAPNSIRWSAVGYLGPHITGGVRKGKLGMPPKRNVSCFEYQQGGGFDFLGGGESGWRLEPNMQAYLHNRVQLYVRTGKVA